MLPVVAQGEAIGPEFLGPLHDSAGIADDPVELSQRMAADGYIYLPGFFNRDDVMAARRDIFTRLASVDEIAVPVLDGIFTGNSSRDENHADRGEFWRSVSETWTLRRLSHGRQLHGLLVVWGVFIEVISQLFAVDSCGWCVFVHSGDKAQVRSWRPRQ